MGLRKTASMLTSCTFTARLLHHLWTFIFGGATEGVPQLSKNAVRFTAKWRL